MSIVTTEHRCDHVPTTLSFYDAWNAYVDFGRRLGWPDVAGIGRVSAASMVDDSPSTIEVDDSAWSALCAEAEW